MSVILKVVRKSGLEMHAAHEANMLKNELYCNEQFRREANERLIAEDLVILYARGLHSNEDVIADLKFAHEANSEEYSDDDFASLGGKVSKYIDDVIRSIGRRPYQARLSGDFDAFSDFNGWYLEQVVYGGALFDAALREYVRISPYIERSKSAG